MTHKNFYLILIFLAAFAGMLFYAIQHEWIIIRKPSHGKNEQQNSVAPSAIKKKVTLYYWHHTKWNSEKIEIVWLESKAQTLQVLINSWLNLLDDEQIMEKKVSLQATMVDQSGNAYISFDRSPFPKSGTTYAKLMWIESLLKTIRENDIKIQGIQFLVHHKPLHDYHLDFSKPWPINGFIN